MMMKYVGLVILAGILTGCAQSSSIPLSKDTFQISTRAARFCGSSGAQKVGLRNAAIRTIEQGYDKFIIVNAQSKTTSEVTGYTPVRAQYHGYGYASYSGGQPIVSKSHGQNMIVKMFKKGQKGSENALSARGQLGPKWKTIVKEKSSTCM